MAFQCAPASGQTQVATATNTTGSTNYRGMGYFYLWDRLSAAQIFSNTLGDGVSFHVQLASPDSFGWFLGGNIYVDTNRNTIPSFFDPASAAVHIAN